MLRYKDEGRYGCVDNDDDVQEAVRLIVLEGFIRLCHFK